MERIVKEMVEQSNGEKRMGEKLVGVKKVSLCAKDFFMRG